MIFDKFMDKFVQYTENRAYYAQLRAERKISEAEFLERTSWYEEEYTYESWAYIKDDFELLVDKGKMTDVYTDDLDYSLMCDRY